MCMCGFERGGGTLGGLGDRDREKGDRDREKGDRDRLAGAWLAGWTRKAEREASKAVTAVAIEVVVRSAQLPLVGSVTFHLGSSHTRVE